MKATMPQLNQTGIIQFKQARHPLLNRDTVVPTDIVLGKEFDTLMITGPNTGGKTVTLKTIGLLSAMAMCGLMLPVAEGSQVSFSVISLWILEMNKVLNNLCLPFLLI